MTYRSEDEALEQIRRERVGAAGRNEALARHIYAHRAATILEKTSAPSAIRPRRSAFDGARLKAYELCYKAEYRLRRAVS